MRRGRSSWPTVLRRGAYGPAGWLSFALAAALLLLPAVHPDMQIGRSALELSAPDPQPTELIIEPPLLAKLQTLAAGLHAEIALCLFGSVRGDTARLDDFHMPEPTVSTASKSLVRPCPERTLAVWHNHPLESGSGYTVGRAWQPLREDRQARRLCVLSKTDILTSLRFRHPFVIVGVDRDTWCWWTRAEVVRLAEEKAWPGIPAPGRLACREDESRQEPLASEAGRGRGAHRLGSPH